MLRKCLLITLLTFSNTLAAAPQESDPNLALLADNLQEWSYSLALQAATYGSPLVTMYALRNNDAVGEHAKAAPNTIWRMEDISTPELSKEAGYVTPNVNTIYGFGFLDLRKEPIILTVPNSNGLYYMVEIVDMWTNAFAYIGGKATGYKGGTYALVGPGFTGELPMGIKRINCPTPWVLLQPRVHIYVDGKVDLERAKQVLQGIVPKGLAEYTGKGESPKAVQYDYPAPEFKDKDLPVSALNFKDPLQFWELMSLAMNENPPPSKQVTAVLPMFKPLGMELGKPWDREKVHPSVLKAMTKAAERIGDILDHMPFGTFYKGTFIPPETIGNSHTDYLTRAIIARVGLTANIPSEAVYWMTSLDENSHALTGNKPYSMTFKQDLPCYPPGFWSITMYDAKNNYTVANPINRYMIGSDSKDLKRDADGSFTIYLQKASPGADKEANWLPTPDGTFYLVTRAYAPKAEAMKVLKNVNAWPIPVVTEVK